MSMQAYSGSTAIIEGFLIHSWTRYFVEEWIIKDVPILCRISVCHVYVRLSQAVGSSWDRSIYICISRLKVKSAFC